MQCINSNGRRLFAMTTRDPAIQELLDKQAIREATMRYCRGVDRCDAELLSSAYHPDGRDDHPGGSYTGETVGVEIVKSMQARMRSTNHHVGTQTIEVDGDTAGSETYSAGRHVLKDGRRLHTLVRYLDRFERRDGEWKIIHRLALTESVEVLPPAETDEQLQAPPLSRRDKTDPSYAFFGAR
jgi:ketosteroid isomerase-like protein